MTATQNETPGLPAGAVPLPDGAWAVLRSHRELMGSDVIEVTSRAVSGKGVMAAATSMRTALIELMVRNWSFEQLPLPATEAVQRRLPGEALVALYRYVQPAYDLVNGKSVAPLFDEQTVDDPASPTPGSSE